ncbi:MAG: hypothetical protein GC168_16100 [Candidatus Hydrogenedens sp.]|nr:hypothetical protein [Candidatus Hydrogenedens sp.]
MKMIKRIALAVGAVLLVGVLLVLIFRWGVDETIIELPAEADAAPAATEFTIASYNVQSRPWLDDIEYNLTRISPKLNAFDVALIQECFDRHDLLWGEADFPNKDYFGRLNVPWKPVGPGLSILTREPVAGTEHLHYRAVGEFQNQLAAKGIQLVRLRIGGMPVDVYNTHMEAGDLPEAHVARHAQSREVAAFIAAQSPPEHAVILGGDYNMGPIQDRPFDPNNRGHYTDATDRDGRASAFAIMPDTLGLRDAQIELDDGAIVEDIERFLFRDGTHVALAPLSLSRDDTFVDEGGQRLSDGAPLVARFRIAPK